MGGSRSLAFDAAHLYIQYVRSHHVGNYLCLALSLEAAARVVTHVALGVIGTISEKFDPRRQFKRAADDLVYGGCFALGAFSRIAGGLVPVGILAHDRWMNQEQKKGNRGSEEKITERYLLLQLGSRMCSPLRPVVSKMSDQLSKVLGVSVTVAEVAAAIIAGVGLLFIVGMPILAVGYTISAI